MTPAGIERIVFSVVLAIVQVGIALYVHTHTRHRVLKAAFSGLGISLAVWTLTIGLAHAPEPRLRPPGPGRRHARRGRPCRPLEAVAGPRLALPVPLPNPAGVVKDGLDGVLASGFDRRIK